MGSSGPLSRRVLAEQWGKITQLILRSDWLLAAAQVRPCTSRSVVEQVFFRQCLTAARSHCLFAAATAAVGVGSAVGLFAAATAAAGGPPAH